MILVVTVHAPKGGANQTLRFAKSPIRIGRNQLNDISLDDPFVSEWHGTLRFDRQSVAYFDLGSTNGSLLEGQRLAKNVATPLTPESRLKLGLIYIQAVRDFSDEVATPAPGHPAARPGQAPQTGQGGAQAEMQQTLPWGVNRAGVFGPGPGPGIATGPGASGAIRNPPGLPGLPAPPPQTGGGGSAWSSGPAPSSDLAASQQAYRPTAPDASADAQRRLLEAFVEAFIGLRKGYEQFGAEVGVRTINGNTPLHRARNQRELLDYLLQPNQDPDSIARDIIAIFADFGIHHIAMMQAVTEGVRRMLQSLGPQATELDAGAKLFSSGKAKTQWRSYVERFEQIINDDNELHTAVFGNEFARAYASVTQGEAGRGAGGDSGDED